MSLRLFNLKRAKYGLTSPLVISGTSEVWSHDGPTTLTLYWHETKLVAVADRIRGSTTGMNHNYTMLDIRDGEFGSRFKPTPHFLSTVNNLSHLKNVLQRSSTRA